MGQTKDEQIVEQIAADIHAGKIKPGDVIAPELIAEIAKHLFDGATTGYGKDYSSGNLRGKDYAMLTGMERNVYQFSGFKTASQIKELHALLHDNNGNVRPWNDFKNDVLMVNNTYNRSYLKSEYNTAVHAANIAEKWQRFKSESSTFPYLRFQTSGSERVCPICSQFNGVVIHINDPWWDSYTPPLHFNCHCTLWQERTGSDSDTEDIDTSKVPPSFRNNPGDLGDILPIEDSPYADFNKKDFTAITNAALELIPDREAYQRVYEGKKGGYVEVSPLHNADELETNMGYAKILADIGDKVKLLDYKEGRKNPDASVNGKVADFKEPVITKKTTQPHLGIQKSIELTNKQNAETPVIYLDKAHQDTSDVYRGLLGSLGKKDWNKSITGVILIYEGKKPKVLKLDRKEIEDKTFKTKLP